MGGDHPWLLDWVCWATTALGFVLSIVSMYQSRVDQKEVAAAGVNGPTLLIAEERLLAAWHVFAAQAVHFIALTWILAIPHGPGAHIAFLMVGSVSFILLRKTMLRRRYRQLLAEYWAAHQREKEKA